MKETELMWADGTVKKAYVEEQAFTIIREEGETDQAYEDAVLTEIHEECKQGWTPTSYNYINGERHQRFERYIYKGEK